MCKDVDVVSKAVERVEMIGLNATEQHDVHVIVESKRVAIDIHAKIGGTNSRIVTSDVSRTEQLEIADQWSKGEFSVLISTTCALVRK